jgi:transcriptional regulator with XRE-family HTH domain
VALPGSIVANQHTRIVPTVPTLAPVLSEEERKERLAYWIRDTMDRRGLTPPAVAKLVGVSRSTVAAWAAGRAVPSLIYLGPLAGALRVDPRLFADLPVIPPSGAAQYLVDEQPPTLVPTASERDLAAFVEQSGVTEGSRRGRRHDVVAPSKQSPSPRRPAPAK